MKQNECQAMTVFFNKFFSHIPKDEYEGFTVEKAHPNHVAKIKIDDWFGKVPENALRSFPLLGEALI